MRKMSQNCYISIAPFFIIIMGLVLQQLQLAIEAKHYIEPFGDIMENNENVFENSYEPKNTQNRHESGSGSRWTNSYQPPGYDLKYQNEFQSQPVGRRRGEKEKTQYQNMEGTNYARNNRNLLRTNSNAWISSASTLEEQQYENLTVEFSGEAMKHKCHIWVPMDALDKYPDAEKKQDNKIAGSVYIEICCKGYAAVRWRGKTHCRPICENCQNGRCVAPGVCECYDEFVANDNGDCVFTCPLGCQNGRCYLDGSCQCEPGYKLDETRKFCRPICSKGCGISRLHNCTEPEVCGCIKGYMLSDNDCQPVCHPDCGSGGICRKPNVCECNPGYELRDGVCQSDCYQKCDNGICYSRNRCICNPGFTYHERSTQCIPK